MAISPGEVLSTLQESEKKALVDLEFNLDTKLCNFNGTPISVGQRFLGNTPRLRTEMLMRYRKAGWMISHQSDFRDGDFYWFSE